MKIIMTYIYLMLILYSNQFIVESNSIVGKAKGNLSRSWYLNFEIKAKILRGVILYCSDSRGNTFELKIPEGIDKARSIRISYNNVSKHLSLNALCNCDPCHESVLKFTIKRQDTVIEINCNNSATERYQTDTTSEKKRLNTDDTVSIRMGNTDSYRTAGNGQVLQSKDYMIGCVNTFEFENSPIVFKISGTDITYMCVGLCMFNNCNGGQCIETNTNTTTCDCSNTAGNGPHCNNTIRPYIRTGNNSYEKMDRVLDTYFKMTWKSKLDEKQFCLLEIIANNREYIIWIDKGRVMLDTSVVGKTNEDETDFVGVKISNNNFTITTKNKSSNLNATNISKLMIHVGFLGYGTKCKTFDGDYDLHYDTSQIRPLVWRQTTRLSTQTTRLSTQTILVSENMSNTWKIIIISFCVSVIIIVLLLCAVILFVVLKLRNKPEPGNYYEVEPIQPKSPNAAHPNEQELLHYYSSADYVNPYSDNSVISTESDGYILPSQIESGPPLPPRY